MFLIQKYTQYKAAQAEQQKRKVTEKELAQLNHKIDKLLTKLDEHEPEIATNQDEECVVCVNAKATMQTYPCGHRVVCRKCFVKTIQMAVAQRLLPLRCVICRAKILRLKHSNGSVPPMSSSASQYTIGHQWYHVPQSASLYSVTSNTSAASGNTLKSVSSASSCSSASSYKTCASSFSAASLKKKSYSNYSKMGYKPLRTSSPSPSRSPQPRSALAMAIAKKDNRVAPAEVPVIPPKGKLTLIQEFQREFRNGKDAKPVSSGAHKYKTDGGSTRIKCARMLVNQAQSSCSSSNQPSPSSDLPNEYPGIGIVPSGGGILKGATGTTPGRNKSCRGTPPSSQSCPSLRLSRRGTVTFSTPTTCPDSNEKGFPGDEQCHTSRKDRSMSISNTNANIAAKNIHSSTLSDIVIPTASVSLRK